MAAPSREIESSVLSIFITLVIIIMYK